MARRRINIALCIIEDGHFNLLTSENLVEILSSALSDLDEAEVIAQGQSGADILQSEGAKYVAELIHSKGVAPETAIKTAELNGFDVRGLDWNAYPTIAG